jgi:hypothetical protein
VIVLFVAMKLLLLGAAEAGLTRDVTFHGKSHALSSSSTAVVIEFRIASTIDEFVTRERITRDDRARGNECAFSTIRKKLLHTSDARAFTTLHNALDAITDAR